MVYLCFRFGRLFTLCLVVCSIHFMLFGLLWLVCFVYLVVVVVVLFPFVVLILWGICLLWFVLGGGVYVVPNNFGV